MISIAHYVTFFRIVLIPFFPILYIEHAYFGISETLLPFILLIILAICEFTDAIDGVIARKKNQVTDLGKVLDPIADSIMRISVFLTFTQKPLSMPLLLVLVFVYRDSLITALRILCALKGYALAARTSGKIKAILQAAVSFFILSLMVFYSFEALSIETFRRWSFFSLAAVAIYTVISAVDYIFANISYIKRSLKP